MANGPFPRRRWGLSEQAFDRMLASLGKDRETSAERYESIRRRLIQFLAWEASLSPEDAADEVLDRVARRLEAGEQIEDMERYALGVARFVRMEERQESQRQRIALSQRPSTLPDDPVADQALQCLENCLRQLPPETQTLLTDYYAGEKRARIERRVQLAARLGIEMNALRNRALRLREKLEACVENCLRRPH